MRWFLNKVLLLVLLGSVLLKLTVCATQIVVLHLISTMLVSTILPRISLARHILLAQTWIGIDV